MIDWVMGSQKEYYIGVDGLGDIFTWDGKTLRQENSSLFDIAIGRDGTTFIMSRKKLREIEAEALTRAEREFSMLSKKRPYPNHEEHRLYRRQLRSEMDFRNPDLKIRS